MPNRDSVMAHTGTLEALQSKTPASSRRARPPDLDLLAQEQNRVPLRPGKATRRESRLGLRNLFSRAKSNKDSAPPSPLGSLSKSSSSRTSLADSSNWPYAASSAPSDQKPTTPRSPRVLSTMFENSQQDVPPVKVTGPAKPTRGPLATWSPPPLFKAFPQAIKHTNLPCATLSTDIILRAYEQRVALAAAQAEEGEPKTEKAKKKRSRQVQVGSLGKMKWTNKIYILATSGCLLQYSADGPFDRLPEKILRLSKNSAAFASDVIPGRHWVVRVQSSTEPEPVAEAHFVLSRAPPRLVNARYPSNILLVFEAADEMEQWIAALRREIEVLGGKKTLDETGKPKVDQEAAALREQPSQRTLVVRDPQRLSRILHMTPAWQESNENEGSVGTAIDTEATMDDVSTTNSFVSHDGRQLENLREGSNRLSFISSGQRTIVTSAGSASPEPSPTVDKFPMQFEEASHSDVSLQSEARPRPNAAAILDRRQSMQVMAPFVDLRGGPVNLRPQSTYGSDPNMPMLVPPRPPVVTPNFSVPNTSNRRFSYMRNHDANAAAQRTVRETESMSRLSRKAPPTTLPVARPLSMVADQPSPMETVHPRPATRHGEDTRSDDVPEVGAQAIDALPEPTISYELPLRRSSMAAHQHAEPHVEINRPISSRRLSNVKAWHKADHLPPPPSMPRTFTAPNGPLPVQKMRSRPSLSGLEEQRCRSSLEMHRPRRSESASTRSRSRKRSSMQSMVSEHRYSVSADLPLPIPLLPESLPEPAPPPSVPLPPIPTEKKSAAAAAPLAGRRSMSQLTEGPPPAPPPTCALPPIPKKPSVMA